MKRLPDTTRAQPRWDTTALEMVMACPISSRPLPRSYPAR
jgi:hypothetical protein